MSSILDALKKLEEEKAAKQASAALTPAEEEAVESADLIEGLRHSPSQPAEGIHLSPKLLLGGGFALVVVLIGVSAMVSLAVVRSNTASSGASQQVASAPAPASAARTDATAAVTNSPAETPASPPETSPAPVDTSVEPETAPSPAVAEAPTPPATAVAEATPEPEPEPSPAPEASEAPAPASAEQAVQVAAVAAPTPDPAPVSSPTPAPTPEAAPVAAPTPEASVEVAAPAAAPAEAAPMPSTAPEESATVPEEAPVARTDPGPVNLRELPLLRNSERVQYGLEDLRLNMIREATPQRPEAMAIINLNKVYVGEMVPATGARLIAVERHGVGIEVGGKRFYVQH